MLTNGGNMQNKNKKYGFTLVEIMLVLALLGLIMTLVGPRIVGALFSGQSKAVKIQIKQIESYLDRYQLDCNFYPTTEQGLVALIEKPSSGRGCPNYSPSGYMPGKKVPQDPWGNDYVYESDGLNFTLKSLGKDGAEGGEGENADISSEDL